MEVILLLLSFSAGSILGWWVGIAVAIRIIQSIKKTMER